MPVSEEQIDRACEALTRTGRRSSRVLELDLPAALDELLDWLADAHQATSTFASNWVLLLDDLHAAAERCGPSLTQALLSDGQSLEELRDCRAVLKGANGPPDASLLRRIERAATGIYNRQREKESVLAAFHDLLDSEDYEHAEVAARLVLSLAELIGHDRQRLPQRLRPILEDRSYAIASQRGLNRPDEPNALAGTRPEERITLVEDALGRAPRPGEVIVWLRFANADLGPQQSFPIGDRVTLFDERWLRSVIKTRRGALADTAPEALQEEAAFDIALLVGDLDEEGTDESTPSPSQCVVVRVVVEEATPSQAEAIARRTADAISGMASLYGTPPRLWQLEDSRVLLTEHGDRSMSFSGAPGTTLNADERSWLADDHTARNLGEVVDRLGLHLPVTDPDIVQATTLLSWLRTARQTEGPARLLLCERVVERVSGWAGYSDPKRFTTEYLRPAWAYDHVRYRVADAAFASETALRQIDAGTELAEEFVDGFSGLGGTVNLKRFLELLTPIAEMLGTASDARDRLERVRRRAAPHLALGWLRELDNDFDRFEGRRLRTRNSLVHGGPATEATVRTAAEFAEIVAVRALGTSIDGRLSKQDLIDHFLDRRSRLQDLRSRLQNQQALSEALFWPKDS